VVLQFCAKDEEKNPEFSVWLAAANSWGSQFFLHQHVFDKVNANFVKSEFGKFNPSEEVSECQVT